MDLLSNEGEGADEEEENSDAVSIDYNRELRANDTSTSAKPSHDGEGRTPSADRFAEMFQLFSYSNGNLLEDHGKLSWYELRPYELLELHRRGSFIPLPRNPVAYAEPYFESRAWLLGPNDVQIDSVEAKVRRALQGKSPEVRKWKEWVVIRDGAIAFSRDLMARVLLS